MPKNNKKLKKSKAKLKAEKKEKFIEIKQHEKPRIVEEQGPSLEFETVSKPTTPVLEKTEPEFKLEDFLRGVEIEKKGEKEKEHAKYTPSLYGEGTKYFDQLKEPEKDFEERQAEEIRHIDRRRARESRETMEIRRAPRERESPFVREERFEEVIKYDTRKEERKPATFEPEFRHPQKKVKKYETIF